MVFSNSTAVGVRRDLHGVLMLDSALQTPVSRAEDTVRVELPLAEVRIYELAFFICENKGVDKNHGVTLQLISAIVLAS